VGDCVVYAFDEPERVRSMRFVFDSDLNRPEHNAHANIPLHIEPVGVPETMVRAFRVEYLTEQGGWKNLVVVQNNYQRLVWLDVDVTTRALRFVPESTWGAQDVHVFAWDVSD
jgi:archaellum component FlaD/FlaE